MKILKIGGKNLASLAGEFSVDFEQEPLASSGLFAISGPTGAGKSTLLDALCLALYDATPRLLKALGRSVLPDVGAETISTQDPRTLLRRGAAEGYAEVDFVGSDGTSYRARWSVRRSRTKAEGALQPTAMSLHQLPALLAIGGTKTEVKIEIEKRIGLSFDQFTRAVLLAQNEFATFLKADDNERGELLETLTGSAIYSEISMRAFERAKLERAELLRLSGRLADQKPLSGEERAELEAQGAAATAALATLDARKAALEQELRWHQQAAKLHEDETRAHAAWQAAMTDVDAAAPRRRDLARLEAVQAARPLADDIARTEADIAATQEAIAALSVQTEQAQAAQQQAAAAIQQAAAQLQQAEDAQRAAAPQLDQAKALDARIEAMLPAHRQAAAARDAADRADAAANGALRHKQDERRQLAGAQEAGGNWLAQHQQWQPLAQSWERWDVLFMQAGQASAQAEKHAYALAALQQTAAQHREDEARATASLSGATEKLQALEAQRQQAIRALAAFDADALQARRPGLEQRRDLLAGGEKIWTELAAKQERKDQLDAQARHLHQARDTADRLLAEAQRENAVIMASFVQAERSLKLAEAACAKNVETLRAALEDDTPCPVCGAHEHPYRDDDGTLHAMLAELQGEVTRCRQQLQTNIGQQATQRTTAEASVELLRDISTELAALDAALARAAQAWDSHPLAAEAAGAGDGRAAWFGAELAAVREGLQQVEQQEQLRRRAGSARDQAQLACDQATAEHARLQTAATTAQAALALSRAEHKALDDKRIEVALQLSALLDELDSAFNSTELPNEGWKDEWKAGPARFHEARRAESKKWLSQRAALDERAAAIATLEVELKALADAHAKTDRDASLARSAYAEADAGLTATQAQRMALWGGKEVREVEAQLQAAIDGAKAQLASRQSAGQQAAEARTRADEALAQATRRLAALRDSALAAAARLAAWLEEFQQRQPAADDALAGVEQLLALLACPAQAIQAERAALQALENAAATAAAVLKERQMQREQHRQSAPPSSAAEAGEEAGGDEEAGGAGGVDGATPSRADALADVLRALAVERQLAHETATAHQLAIAQDNARRHAAQSMLAEIALQEAVEQRWARMDDLIGSSDGKRFRNYAQQFTLDVLLGYANAHLGHLARRYRLERISHAANPSLGLLVRDQDMGGEMRSVHSLSGGESFLVSLALALGLASLSSNRVKVESLFIDEGFGSLDAETLRVAMDALDGLQSMGRKVGVISHVQEMTERISTRILVQPSAGGKSVVTVQ